QQLRQLGERPSRASLRERFSASARRNAVEKYYDCLQCAEQCRHVTTLTNSATNNNSSLASNNNSFKQARNAKSNYRVMNSINSSSLKENAKILTRLDETRVLRNPKTANLTRTIKSQPLPLTPAKKRSSLARPVRVHDSSSQSRKLVPVNQAFQNLQRTNEPTYYEEDEHEGTGWAIRLRLEQMLELNLPIKLTKQQQASKHTCNDTERLLRVLSVNNVDQNTRYNVTRCFVM
ncbi:PREDICTED: uncharacterized protein LOC108580266, partial [Habropoda laboriosa]|uniref:uncharacterized protein LOC108580266 n=1 Tax=Habropoda laboriosa TaxID=597456 RepID=UPI00083D6F68